MRSSAAHGRRLGAPRTALIGAMLAIVVFSVVRAVFAFGQQYNAERISQNVAFDFRNELFAKIQRLSFSYHDRNQTGQLMIRATDDVEKVRLFIGQGLVMALQSFVLLVATLLVLWFTNRAADAGDPADSADRVRRRSSSSARSPSRCSWRVQIRAERAEHRAAGKRGRTQGGQGLRPRARRSRRASDARPTALFDQQIKVARVFSFLFPVIFLIANLGQAAVLYFGGRQIIDGTLTLGEWQKFSLYLAYVFLPMGQLGFIINLMSQASASAQRIFEILDTTNEIQDKPGALDAGRGQRRGRVRQRHLPLLQRRRRRAERRLVRRPSPARRSRCSAPPAAARPRSSTCCRASTTSPRAACWSTATTCAT